MFMVLLFLVAAWIVLVVIGAVLKGLFWLFVIGLILFVVTSLFAWARRPGR